MALKRNYCINRGFLEERERYIEKESSGICKDLIGSFSQQGEEVTLDLLAKVLELEQAELEYPISYSKSISYKDIDAVMEAQKDLVEIITTIKQVVCVKG